MKATMYVLMGLVVGLAGCAAPQPLPQHLYEEIAFKWTDTRRCAQNGHLSAELASIGDWHVRKLYERYVIDPQYGKQMVQQYLEANPVLSVERCTDLAILYETIKRNLNAGGGAPRSSLPTYTTCNRIGTITNCSSY